MFILVFFYQQVNLFFPIIFLSLCLYITFMIFVMQPKDFLFSMFTYLVGIVSYFCFVVSKKPKVVEMVLSSITIAAQKLTLSAMVDKRE